MNERDDYLSDPTQPVDREVAALEQALAPLRWRARACPEVALPRRRRWPLFAAAVAVAAAMLVAAWFLFTTVDDDSLRPGAAMRTFATKATARTVPLGDLAEITLHPGSELQFRHWHAGTQALFALQRGAISVRVQPPPAVPVEFFVVDTPVGRVVDMGCRYELQLRSDGSAHVLVTEGAVTFRAGDRTVWVPVDAAVVVDARGPGTPCFLDASDDLRKAVLEFDAVAQKALDLDTRLMSLKLVINEIASPRDSLVLWHLLGDPEPQVRAVADAELRALVGSPPGVGKEPELTAADWLAHLRLAFWQPVRGK